MRVSQEDSVLTVQTRLQETDSHSHLGCHGLSYTQESALKLHRLTSDLQPSTFLSSVAQANKMTGDWLLKGGMITPVASITVLFRFATFER